MNKNYRIIKETNSFTAMYLGRVQNDKRHTCVQFNAKTENQAVSKLEKWLKSKDVISSEEWLEHIKYRSNI